MNKKIINFGMLVLVFGMLVIGCDDSIDDDKNDITTDFTFTREPVPVQEALDKVIVKQESTSSVKFQSASYDPDLDYIFLTYKVGTVQNMFLQYLSAVVVAEKGREFTYTEVRGHSETMQTENINTITMNYSGKVRGAIAGANVFAGLASLSGLGPQAKANAYALVGKFDFDISSVITSRYTHTYQDFLVVSNSLKQDMSIYPTGKKYAVAAFADVGVYQILRYDHQTRTATAIPGKSLWFNVESMPVWDMYEYSREEELSIPQQLKPFEIVNVSVADADLFESLTKSHSETRSNKIEYIGGNYNEIKTETFNYNLPISTLKQLGYTKLRINFSFDYIGYQQFAKFCATLRVMINHNNNEIGNAEFACKHVSTRASFSTDISLNSINTNSGQFKILWHRYPDGNIFTWSDEFLVGNRTITITAEK